MNIKPKRTQMPKLFVFLFCQHRPTWQWRIWIQARGVSTENTKKSKTLLVKKRKKKNPSSRVKLWDPWDLRRVSLGSMRCGQPPQIIPCECVVVVVSGWWHYHYLLCFAVAENKKEVSMKHGHNPTKERTKQRTKQNAKVDTNVEMHNYTQWPKTSLRNKSK